VRLGLLINRLEFDQKTGIEIAGAPYTMLCEKCDTKMDANGVCGWCGNCRSAPNVKGTGGDSRNRQLLLWTGVIAIVLTVELGSAEYLLREADSLPGNGSLTTVLQCVRESVTGFRSPT
jgi:hypothetical protein